jgi:hypothetical protein
LGRALQGESGQAAADVKCGRSFVHSQHVSQ